MQIRIKRRYDKFTRETAFFDDNQGDFAPASEVRKHLATLKEIVLEALRSTFPLTSSRICNPTSLRLAARTPSLTT